MRTGTIRWSILWMFCLLVVATAGHAQWVENGIDLAQYTGYQGDQDILADGSGGAFIVWQDHRNAANPDLYAQRIDALGNELWTPDGVNVSKGLAGEQRAARIVSDEAGGIIVVYEDNNAGDYDIKAQRLDGDGNILWLYPIIMCSATGDQRRVAIVEDGTGGAIVAWEDERSGNWDVYARRISQTGTQWAAPNGVAICVQSGDQTTLDAVTDGAGSTIIAWQDLRGGTYYDVYAQRVNLSGTVQWTTDGQIICNAARSQYGPQLLDDGSSGVFVTWDDYRNTVDSDVYAQHVNFLGSVSWTSNGVAIATAAGDEWAPVIATDGSGGAVIAFTADGGLNGNNIKAQRINAAGAVQWLSNGREVCGKAGDQEWCEIVAASDGGVFIAWEDSRWGDEDLYVQKIDDNGDPEWEIDGVPVARAEYNQSVVRFVEVDDGGCIFSWMDYRHGIGDWDVYCQRIDQYSDWGYLAPTNVVVEDVPEDQGGYVMVTWDASRLDTHANGQVTYYTIYRSLTGPPTYAWLGVGSFMAIDEAVYTYTDATSADSSGSGPALQYYKVRARTADSGVYWESYPVSGYSVDNSVPAPPAPVAGEQRADPAGLEITWVQSTEQDFSHYAVYRGTDSDFGPSPQNRIAETEEPVYFDGSWLWSAGFCYKVTTVDDNDNESAAAVLLPDEVTGVGTQGPSYSNSLAQNVPNPFNPSTRIAYAIQAASEVSLRIYDAHGRLVRELVNRRLGPGHYEEEWNGRTLEGRSVASGVYFYKLTAGSFVETRKMVFLK